MPSPSRAVPSRARVAAALAVSSLLGCSDDGGPAAAAPADAGVDAAPACDPHATVGPPTFSDRTAAWGLAGVRGNRLSTPDLDGDGYPDLVVHRVYSNQRDDLAPETPRLVRVSMNRPAPGGGRTFVDRTVESGLFAPREGSGLRSAQLAVFADVDDDGDLDAFSGTYTDPARVASPPTDADGDRSELLLNDGTGTFVAGPPLEPHASLAMTTTAATFADVDRDGHVDLFVAGWYSYYGFSSEGTQARLHLGRGDGTFEEVTSRAGLLTDSLGHADGGNHRPAYGVTSCDVDDDGDTDLLLAAYGRQWNLSYRNDGAGIFREVGRADGYAGDPNASYADNQFFLCWCTLHADASCPAGVSPSIACPSPADSGWGASDTLPWRQNGNTFTTACADVTGDGLADLYSAEIHHWWAGEGSDGSELLVGQRDAAGHRFIRSGNAQAGLVWPRVGVDWNEGGIVAALADVDGDGRRDVLVGASDYADQRFLLFHQRADGTFEETARAWGVDHPCASGLALADFDADGDLDLLLAASTARDCGATWGDNEVRLYESDAAAKARFVTLALAGGSGVNGAAIGAQARVTAGGVTQVGEVQGGYGHFGLGGDTRLHFGLGACERADSVEIRWPDQALTTTQHGVAAAGGVVRIER
ncbi:MAG: VCBS repeat-containing protein [Polyangiaceae bacterium]|nr:VCBS repeat-containing protein [Polyangiaceae bacterium]